MMMNGASRETPDPGEMARLIDDQQRSMARRLSRLGSTIMAAWGAVWVIAYLAKWSGPLGGNPWFRLAAPVDDIIIAVVIAAAGIASGVIGARMGGGTRGPTSRNGALYGWTISIGTAVVVMFTVALARAGVDEQALSLIFPGMFTVVFATLYMLSAPLIGSRVPFYSGLALCLAVLVATTVGAPHHWLVYAASGCTFFVTAALAGRAVAPLTGA